MKKSNLYGASALELAAAKLAIETALGESLNAHESDYRGGDYFRLELRDANLILQANFEEDDGETTEAEYPNETVLLYLDGEAKAVDAFSELVANRLHPFKLLRTGTY